MSFYQMNPNFFISEVLLISILPFLPVHVLKDAISPLKANCLIVCSEMPSNCLVHSLIVSISVGAFGAVALEGSYYESNSSTSIYSSIRAMSLHINSVFCSFVIRILLCFLQKYPTIFGPYLGFINSQMTILRHLRVFSFTMIRLLSFIQHRAVLCP